MIKKLLNKFLKKDHTPEINPDILYLILKELLEEKSEFSFRLGNRKFIRHEFSGRGLGLCFQDSVKGYVLYICPKCVHVFDGEYSLVAKWISENNEIELSEDHKHIFNLLWKNYYKTSHPDLGE